MGVDVNDLEAGEDKGEGDEGDGEGVVEIVSAGVNSILVLFLRRPRVPITCSPSSAERTGSSSSDLLTVTLVSPPPGPR